MKVRFLKSCGTALASYSKGRVYDLPKDVAQQFIRESLAVKVAENRTEKSKPAPKPVQAKETADKKPAVRKKRTYKKKSE